MESQFYNTNKPGKVIKFLWASAGGDEYILERSTYSDQVKYACLGGIVFATGLMAGLSGGYAFYTIFEPRGNVLENPIHIPTVFMALVFGVVWGLMIFNLDRFIVAATGKGDGTEKITWDELKGALPRIIMGMIIAVSISKPVEIRMFKTEIDTELRKIQIQKQTEYAAEVDKTYAERERNLEKDFGKVSEERKKLLKSLEEYDKKYQDEMAQGQGGRGKGEGPVALALRRERDKADERLAKFDEQNQAELQNLNERKDALRKEKEKERLNNKKAADGLDGLLERIKIAHEVAGFSITLFITLLFMAIELTPIFFKLMLTKTPYDYLKENIEDMMMANNGIEIKYDYYKDKKGLERHLVINHEADIKLYEKIKESDIQKELSDYAIEKYKQNEKDIIDHNPDLYIRKNTSLKSGEEFREELAKELQDLTQQLDARTQRELLAFAYARHKQNEESAIMNNPEAYIESAKKKIESDVPESPIDAADQDEDKSNMA